MAERTVDDIQHEIEAARVSLAQTVDQLTYRANPQRLLEKAKTTLTEQLQTPRGKAVAGGAGGLVALMMVRKIFKR